MYSLQEWHMRHLRVLQLLFILVEMIIINIAITRWTECKMTLWWNTNVTQNLHPQPHPHKSLSMYLTHKKIYTVRILTVVMQYSIKIDNLWKSLRIESIEIKMIFDGRMKLRIRRIHLHNRKSGYFYLHIAHYYKALALKAHFI